MSQGPMWLTWIGRGSFSVSGGRITRALVCMKASKGKCIHYLSIEDYAKWQAQEQEALLEAAQELARENQELESQLDALKEEIKRFKETLTPEALPQ